MKTNKEMLMDSIRENPADTVTQLVLADLCEEEGDTETAELLRAGKIPFLIQRGDRKLFEKSIIAQDDDEDYEESGYVVVRIGDWCAIGAYGHCSCYDTWADLTGGGISDDEGPNPPSWKWQGSYEQLVDMAKRKADPAMPEREANPEDFDYDHLCKVYEQVLSKN